ncbi:MAG: thioredoxin-dependent thiol peroxidase [Dehalococcoidia bacterium]|nr:thioredoxin-dependent thiol peroxidase [Dehalococcoidia bacterium]
MAELKVGDTAPDFDTLNDAGERVRLSDLRRKRVVLYFYPKDNTTGCTAQACAFRDSYPQITDQNAIVLGVSPDSAKSHQSFRTKHDLPFPLLLDPEHKIAEAYDVWREKSMYGRKYMGILRSHFVIDEEGRIADAKYNVKAADSARLSLATLEA